MVESEQAGNSPAPRHKIELHSQVISTAAGKRADGEVNYSFFRASTFDLSMSGLGLIMHQFEVEELCSLGKETVFRFTLPVATGSIELEAEPVRFQLLDADGESFVLVGTRITNMDDKNAEDYFRFVWMLEEGQ